MKYVVDRIEEDILVLQDESENMINHKMSDKEKELKIKEGDVVFLNDNLCLEVQKEETLEREERIKKKMLDIFK